MTDHRSDRVPLPASEERCEPAGTCIAKGSCARYKAAILRGSPLTDHSASPGGGTVLCIGYVNTSTLHVQANPRPVKVHPPMGSGA